MQPASPRAHQVQALGVAVPQLVREVGHQHGQQAGARRGHQRQHLRAGGRPGPVRGCTAARLQRQWGCTTNKPSGAVVLSLCATNALRAPNRLGATTGYKLLLHTGHSCSHRCAHSGVWGRTAASGPSIFLPQPRCDVRHLRLLLLPRQKWPDSSGHAASTCNAARPPAVQLLLLLGWG